MISDHKPERHKAFWSRAEESLLYDETIEGRDHEDIQKAHCRTRYSIIKRQKKLGLRNEKSKLVAPFPSTDDLAFTYVPAWLRGPLAEPRSRAQNAAEARLSAIFSNTIWPNEIEGEVGSPLTAPLRRAKGDRTFFSEKLKREVHCESFAEYKVLKALEAHPLVTKYMEQPLAIPYQSDGQPRKYYPDIFVQIGSIKIIIEIKGFNSLSAYSTLVKRQAAIKYLSSRGIGYAFSDYRGKGLKDIFKTEVNPEVEDMILTLIGKHRIVNDEIFHQHLEIASDFKWQLQAIALKHHLHLTHKWQQETAYFQIRKLADHEDDTVFPLALVQ